MLADGGCGFGCSSGYVFLASGLWDRLAVAVVGQPRVNVASVVVLREESRACLAPPRLRGGPAGAAPPAPDSTCHCHCTGRHCLRHTTPSLDKAHAAVRRANYGAVGTLAFRMLFDYPSDSTVPLRLNPTQSCPVLSNASLLVVFVLLHVSVLDVLPLALSSASAYALRAVTFHLRLG